MKIGDRDIDPKWVAAGAVGVTTVLSVGWYLHRASQRKELVAKLSTSALVQQAQAAGWIHWDLSAKAAEFLPVFDANSVDAAFLEAMDQVRDNMPPEALASEATTLSMIEDVGRIIEQKTGIDVARVWDSLPNVPFIDVASWIKS